MIQLFHDPYSRAANTLWMLEEIGVPYELEFVNIMKGEHKRSSRLMAANPIGKIPTLLDGDVVGTESAAIGLYLADRYAYGTLAPKVERVGKSSEFSVEGPERVPAGVL